jgi:hypothetical protein
MVPQGTSIHQHMMAGIAAFGFTAQAGGWSFRRLMPERDGVLDVGEHIGAYPDWTRQLLEKLQGVHNTPFDDPPPNRMASESKQPALHAVT